jgi:hypothetical protein
MGEFWLTNPSQLCSTELLPSSDMSDAERVNAFTRLILVITLILFFAFRGQDHWWKFLLCSLIIILLLYFSMRNSDSHYVRYYSCSPRIISPEFSFTPLPDSELDRPAPVPPAPRPHLLNYVAL